MDNYSISPEKYEQQQREAYQKFSENINEKCKPLYAEQKKLQSVRGLTDSFSIGEIIIGMVILFFVGCALGGFNPTISYCIFAAMIIVPIISAVRKSSAKTRLDEISDEIKEATRKKEEESQSMYTRIQKYKTEYIALHSQKLAVNMASSAAVKTIAGQLSVLFKQEIDGADRNGYIQIIDIKMELYVFEDSVRYEFYQKGTVNQKPREAKYFSLSQFGAERLKTQEEMNGAAQAISSMIQTNLLEKYISDNPSPTVTVEKNYNRFNSTASYGDNAFIISFRQTNKDYQGENSWM